MGEITRRGAIGALALPFAMTQAQAAQTPAAPAEEGPRPAFSFVLVNDIYRVNAEDGRGGYARLAAVVKAERARGVPMLFVHAGDAFSPSLLSGFDQGAHVVALTNLLQPDAFTPGNHEFDFGPEVYAKRVSEARFPFFAANMRDARGRPLPGHADRRIFTLGGYRVGLTGITLSDIPMQSNAGDLTFAPVMETLEEQAALLRREGAQFVVALTHTDRDTDLRIIRSGLVDLLLTGHVHDLFIYWDEQTAAVESSHDANYVTTVDVHVEPGDRGGRLRWSPDFRIHDTLRVAPDPQMQAQVDALEQELSQSLDVALAVLGGELDTRAASVRYREATGGDLVADAIREMSGADVAIVNGGSIRGDRVYPAGATLTRRDILTELPFGNRTVVVKASGATLKKALENGFSRLDARAGRFPQISGMRVTVDPSRPAGDRVTSLEIGARPAGPADAYSVAINDYMLRGGDGYGMFATDDGRGVDAGNRLLASDVMAWLRRKGRFTPRLDGRIRIETGPAARADSAAGAAADTAARGPAR
ncbi:bifunctional metallophosphatase/5'-nucleotidase [Camelimonas abortus]|uniref:Bifunctional metallophosphatase/5'-nucleotidase n=1 Tax=Camelimonas abortus TaxID=1017184 RepID=A0ABV7LFQ2_9HYPH